MIPWWGWVIIGGLGFVVLAWLVVLLVLTRFARATAVAFNDDFHRTGPGQHRQRDRRPLF